MTTIAVTNQKGGVGKTTTAVNLAAEMAALGRRTLLIDLDPQGNAATALGIAPEDRTPGVMALWLQGGLVPGAMMRTSIENLWILPSGLDLASVDHQQLRDFLRKGGLRQALTTHLLHDGHAPEIVLIDCPPALSLLTVTALAAANYALVPVQAEFLALEGLSQLMFTIEQIQATLNADLRIGGVVLTMADARNRLSREIEQDLRQTLGPIVLESVIPRNVRVSEAQSHGLPISVYDPGARAAIAYRALGREVLALIERDTRGGSK